MAKTIKEQIEEALAPVQAELEAKRERIAELEVETATQTERIRELNAELAAFRSATAEPAGILQDIDLSAGIYRDALADFAIRVLSGGVVINFREARS